MNLKVAVAGASGYVGGELLRLISSHPSLDLVTVTANSNAGQTVAAIHPELTKFKDLIFVETSAETLAGHDVIFLALPHTKSAEVASWLAQSVLVLDCGADFRLESALEFEKFYHSPHAGTWAYGMPELLINSKDKQRTELVGQKRIAVPGCNATAITIAFAPLLAANLIEASDLVSTLSVGTSGSGANAEVNQGDGLHSAFAYQVGGIHRHIPEIKQNLDRLTASPVSPVTLTFTPVLVPMFRGILAVNTAKLVAGTTVADLRKAFADVYGSEQYVDVLPAGQFPDTEDVELINRAAIGFAIDEETGRVIVISAIDNLVKGTAGAAIQSMNIALGLAENLGIPEGASK
ncbi:MAG: N-acetyl-gamma-glutamyl-phosphate reductase [Rhodoluna sp.]|nr:N-acetyl-gamma-glutamyl-phosphate reductase [Rhodoluna sp.]